jgi:hypothetical protein
MSPGEMGLSVHPRQGKDFLHKVLEAKHLETKSSMFRMLPISFSCVTYPRRQKIRERQNKDGTKMEKNKIREKGGGGGRGGGGGACT